MTSARLAVANLAVATLHVLLTEELSTFQNSSLEKVLETLRSIASPNLQNLTSEEHALMVSGKKIQAIKSVRDRTNSGLKEAKHLVEKFYPSTYVPPSALPSSWREGCGDPECCR